MKRKQICAGLVQTGAMAIAVLSLRAGPFRELHGFAELTRSCSSLVQGAEGVFYGTTTGDSSNGWGSVFSVTKDGALVVLAAFGQANGANPNGPLLFDADGSLYGTTIQGGAWGNGTV